jgi:hypothetical protein
MISGENSIFSTYPLYAIRPVSWLLRTFHQAQSRLSIPALHVWHIVGRSRHHEPSKTTISRRRKSDELFEAVNRHRRWQGGILAIQATEFGSIRDDFHVHRVFTVLPFVRPISYI